MFVLMEQQKQLKDKALIPSLISLLGNQQVQLALP
ncbi:hypothetical protein AQAU111925_06785 [Aquirufa aurantiipilula]